MSISSGKKKEKLDQLQKEFMDFREKEITDFKQELDVCAKKMQEQKNCKYPPASPNKAYEKYQKLSDKILLLISKFRKLKKNAFQEVEKFLTIKIH